MAKLPLNELDLNVDPRSRVTIVYERDDLRGITRTIVDIQPVKESGLSKATQQLLAYVFGVVFITVLLVIAFAVPNPTPFQYTVFRIVLALASGGVAAMIPGFLKVDVPKYVQAGGALGVFAVVYFFSPAALVVE